MKKIWKNYKQTFILLASLIIGGIVGIIFKEKATVLNPLGTLYLNMMFVLIVPLIFLTISTTIAKNKNRKRLGKLLRTIVIVFIITSLVSLVVGVISTYSVKLVDTSKVSTIMDGVTTDTSSDDELNILERTVEAISTDDFYKLLSRDNLIALVIFAILVGLAILECGEKGEKFLDVLTSANAVVLKLVDMAFLYAPIGIGCFFASLVGTMGSTIATSFIKTFIVYLVVALLFYFVIYSLYAFIAGGKKGLKDFIGHIIPVSASSIATCSSAACIPINIKCAKEIGVSSDIAETTIPLGTTFHKDGSIIGSVFKIMFLAYLLGFDIYNVGNIGKIMLVSLVATLLVSAVPIGGGTISEMLIITLMGFPVSFLPILTIIATIIDAPATMLNVVGDSASSMLVARIIDGKGWNLAKNT